MNKIIGFLISKEDEIPRYDFFDYKLNLITVKHNNYNIYLWGIGNIEKCKLDEKYPLSFPLHVDLLDRNILISLEADNIIVENDWLGSIPIFYNNKENIISTLSNLCLKDKTIHAEGLSNFCEFGYSVFEQTIFEDVKFMRYYSKLIISYDIEVEYKKDPVLDSSFTDKELNEGDIINLMQKYVSNIESSIDGNIVLPTSGGYDSRILTSMVKDKKRIRSFTYGISKNQDRSFEVVHAKKISGIYNTHWSQVELNHYHDFSDKWSQIYGFSTHQHGMYHIEFYAEIAKMYDFSNDSFLSGIIGDAWAELGKFKEITNINDIVNLGYTHGMCLSLEHIEYQSRNISSQQFFDSNHDYLVNDKIRTVFAMRTKLMLISYLTQIPEYYGLPVWTPFLNFDIVKSTVSLPESRRKNRNWQKDYFQKIGLNLEDMSLTSIKTNALDFEIARKAKLPLIDIDTMKVHINEKRLSEINTILGHVSTYDLIKDYFLNIPKVGGLLRIIGFKNRYLEALYEYYVIKAIEKGLKQ